jgi:TPP-dependent pyruvate/acetoin dehydrogenase alpha subunit
VFLDCVTFRSGTYSSHFGETRPGIEKEIAKWEQRDPLKRMGEWLIVHELASAEDLERLQRDEDERIEAAFSQVLAETKGS